MDNPCPHKSEPTLSLIAQAGAEVLFLPAYSPEFNPIEKMWSKIKAALRSAQARTQPALIKAIASALLSVTPQDATNWFAHCGYSSIRTQRVIRMASSVNQGRCHTLPIAMAAFKAMLRLRTMDSGKSRIGHSQFSQNPLSDKLGGFPSRANLT